MSKVQNGVETLPKISTGLVGCTNVIQTTDGQTELRRSDNIFRLLLLLLLLL